MAHTVALAPPGVSELADLMAAVGWGTNSLSDLAQSISAYPCTICARAQDGQLVGYASVFSDGVLSTMLGEFVVHPRHQRTGVATSMLAAIEAKYPNAAIYIKALGESKSFYAARGFKVPRAEMTVMFKRPRGHG